MHQVDSIIIHCSDSPWGCTREIRKWHQGKGWADVGYHFVVLNGKVMPDLYLTTLDGCIEAGRRLDGDMHIEGDEAGAHALGYNDRSIGICLIGERKNGEATFTTEQFYALRALCLELCLRFKIEAAGVLGHRETASGKAQKKTCPEFDVDDIRKYLKGRII